MKLRKIAAVAVTGAVLTLVPSAFAEDGAAVYKANCAMCHKADASGNPAMKAPALKGKSDADVTKAIESNPKHASVKKKLSAEQVKAVAEYVKSLK